MQVTKHNWAELNKLETAQLFELAKPAVKLFGAIKVSREKFHGALQNAGKVVAALKVRFTQARELKKIPADTSFAKYHEENIGGKCPPRVEAIAGLWNALVETGKITETIYDAAHVDWLEKANAIVNRARKIYGEKFLESSDVKEVINALSKPGDALKILREIHGRQTAQPAKSLLERIAEIGAEIAHLEDVKMAQSAYYQLDAAILMFERNADANNVRRFPDEMIDNWLQQRDQQNAPIQILEAGEPVEVAAAA